MRMIRKSPLNKGLLAMLPPDEEPEKEVEIPSEYIHRNEIEFRIFRLTFLLSLKILKRE